MDAGHSFVGMAIAVQMLVGVCYDAEERSVEFVYM
jgi:hypothetical protein